jgi:UDP-3-O-[3-hydroxymyristoyl] glucosamine N-acyltransferase
VLSKIEEGKEGSLTFVKPKIQTITFIATATITIVNKTFVPESALKRP